MNRPLALLSIYLIGCLFQWGYFVNRPHLIMAEREIPDEFSSNVLPMMNAPFWPIYWPAQLVKHLTLP